MKYIQARLIEALSTRKRTRGAFSGLGIREGCILPNDSSFSGLSTVSSTHNNMASICSKLILLAKACVAAPVDQALFSVGPKTQRGFLWSAIGLAVATALLQGFVSALA